MKIMDIYYKSYTRDINTLYHKMKCLVSYGEWHLQHWRVKS